MSDSTNKVIITPDLVSDKWKPVITVLNFIGVIFWATLTYVVIVKSQDIMSVASNQVAYLGLIVPAVAYGILSLVAGTALVNILNPWFNFIDLMKGDGYSKLSGAIIWFGTMISIALIIKGAR